MGLSASFPFSWVGIPFSSNCVYLASPLNISLGFMLIYNYKSKYFLQLFLLLSLFLFFFLLLILLLLLSLLYQNFLRFVFPDRRITHLLVFQSNTQLHHFLISKLIAQLKNFFEIRFSILSDSIPEFYNAVDELFLLWVFSPTWLEILQAHWIKGGFANFHCLLEE